MSLLLCRGLKLGSCWKSSFADKTWSLLAKSLEWSSSRSSIFRKDTECNFLSLLCSWLSAASTFSCFIESCSVNASRRMKEGRSSGGSGKNSWQFPFPGLGLSRYKSPCKSLSLRRFAWLFWLHLEIQALLTTGSLLPLMVARLGSQQSLWLLQVVSSSRKVFCLSSEHSLAFQLFNSSFWLILNYYKSSIL